MVAYLRGRRPGRIVSSFALFLLLGFSNPAQADEFFPSNLWPQSFTTLQAAEDAMRAVSADAALLQFDSILGSSGNWTYRVYTVPPVPVSPPFWSDCGNVPGYYDSGQAVCDARRTWINWGPPLTYTPDPAKPLDGFGVLGSCRDSGNLLGRPGRWVSCPSGYNLANVTMLGGLCGSTSVGWGPNVNCMNYTTAIITVKKEEECPIAPLPDPIIPLADEEAWRFERAIGKIFDYDNLSNAMKTALACMERDVPPLGGTTIRESGYRPPGYQLHLRQVWDKNVEIDKKFETLSEPQKQACTALVAQVKNEMSTHRIGFRPVNNSCHERKPACAFDLIVTMSSGDKLDARIDFAAFGCGLRRFDFYNDPNHFSGR